MYVRVHCTVKHNTQVKLHELVHSKKEHLFHECLKRHLKHLLLCSLFTVTAQLCTVNKSRKYMYTLYICMYVQVAQYKKYMYTYLHT